MPNSRQVNPTTRKPSRSKSGRKTKKSRVGTEVRAPVGDPTTTEECICLPDPAGEGLVEGTLLYVHDGEWMTLPPGNPGAVLSVGEGGTLLWVDP